MVQLREALLYIDGLLRLFSFYIRAREFGKHLLGEKTHLFGFLDTVRLVLAGILEGRAHFACVGEIARPTGVHLLEILRQERLRFVVERHAVLRYHAAENLRQFVGVIVMELDGLVESRLKAGVGTDEIRHLFVVTGGDAYELAAAVLHQFE